MSKWKLRSINFGWILIALILMIEFVIDIQKSGDFVGYVQAGQLVIDQQDIYSDYLNTWPPLFSIFSVPLTVLDSWSPTTVRGLWLLGSILAFALVVKLSVKMLANQKLNLRPGLGKLSFREPIVLIPVLLSLRYLMDNLANIQINVYLLLLCLVAVQQFSKGNYRMTGLLLALGISLKVYPVFLFLYFLYKREFRVVLWTIVLVIMLNSISLLVFGIEEGINYYLTWQQEVTPRSFMANHKNQSLFGVMLRLFTDMNPDHGLYTNLTSLEPALVKRYTYLLIAVLAMVPAYLFRRRLKEQSQLKRLLEYSFVITAITLLSPIAWKAYFIFLWPGIFMSYNLLYQTTTTLENRVLRLLKTIFWLSMILVIGTAEIFVGPHLSDIFESYSLISLGTALLLVIQLYLHQKSDNFDTGQMNLYFRRA